MPNIDNYAKDGQISGEELLLATDNHKTVNIEVDTLVSHIENEIVPNLGAAVDDYFQENPTPAVVSFGDGPGFVAPEAEGNNTDPWPTDKIPDLSVAKITDLPVIPGSTNQLVNNSGYVSSGDIPPTATWATIEGRPTNIVLTNNSQTLTNKTYADPTFAGTFTLPITTSTEATASAHPIGVDDSGNVVTVADAPLGSLATLSSVDLSNEGMVTGILGSNHLPNFALSEIHTHTLAGVAYADLAAIVADGNDNGDATPGADTAIWHVGDTGITLDGHTYLYTGDEDPTGLGAEDFHELVSPTSGVSSIEAGTGLLIDGDAGTPHNGPVEVTVDAANFPKVPSATAADSATTAGSATSATSATNATNATNVVVIDRTDSDNTLNLQFEIIANDGTPTGNGFITFREDA